MKKSCCSCSRDRKINFYSSLNWLGCSNSEHHDAHSDARRVCAQGLISCKCVQVQLCIYCCLLVAHLSGEPLSCATTSLPKSRGCLSSLEMQCTSLEPSGSIARKYSPWPTTSCSCCRAALPVAFGRAVNAKPCAACWNAYNTGVLVCAK